MSASTGLVFHGVGHKTDLNQAAPANVNIVDSSRNKIVLAKNGTVTQEQLATGLWVNTYDGATGYHQNLGVDINLQNDATIMVWVYIPSSIATSGVFHYVVELNDGVDQNRIVLFKSSAANQFGIIWEGNNIVEDAYIVDASLFDDSWHYLGIVKSGVNLTIYLDAESVSTVGDAVDMVTPLTEIYIGTNDTQSGFWPGSIDEVRVFDYALSESDIKRVMMGLQPIGRE